MILKSVVIVGASLAGQCAASAFRRHGYSGHLTMVGEESFPPYERPALSKQYLAGSCPQSEVMLRCDDLGVDLRLSERAVGLDMDERRVQTTRGFLPFDGLVIATGSRPRRPRWMDDLDFAYSLRTIADCNAIRARLSFDDTRVAIVGAGFIGLEAAATCRGLQHDVVVFDVAEAPMSSAVGRPLATFLRGLHEQNGVRLRTGTRISCAEMKGSLSSLVLGTGEQVLAGVVIVGVGVEPSVEWLLESGLPLDNGVVCDQTCAVVGTEGVVAAGDVARWYHRAYGQPVRVEHWENAVRQADAAVLRLLNGSGVAPYCPAPYFWSDHYGTRLQVLGLPSVDDEFEVIEGALEEGRMVAYYKRGGRAVGAALLNSASRLGGVRKRIQSELDEIALHS